MTERANVVKDQARASSRTVCQCRFAREKRKSNRTSAREFDGERRQAKTAARKTTAPDLAGELTRLRTRVESLELHCRPTPK